MGHRLSAQPTLRMHDNSRLTQECESDPASLNSSLHIPYSVRGVLLPHAHYLCGTQTRGKICSFHWYNGWNHVLRTTLADQGKGSSVREAQKWPHTRRHLVHSRLLAVSTSSEVMDITNGYPLKAIFPLPTLRWRNRRILSSAVTAKIKSAYTPRSCRPPSSATQDFHAAYLLLIQPKTEASIAYQR